MNTLQNNITAIKSEEDFDKKVLQKNLPTIILFKTVWSGDSFLMGGIFGEIQSELSEKIQLFSIDIEKLPTLKDRFYISKVPTVLFIKDGIIVSKILSILPSNIIILQVNSFVDSTAKGA